jgi:hypothetical protein
MEAWLLLMFDKSRTMTVTDISVLTVAPAACVWCRQGFLQAIVQRTLSTGLYFPLEDLFMSPCRT